ncbi:hypothetical protein BJX64DRAFT_273244 [Aspergillus heterothallicus]
MPYPFTKDQQGLKAKRLSCIQMKYPFTDYAAESWFDHARRLPEISKPIQTQLIHFMGHENLAFPVWANTVMQFKDLKVSRMTLIHAAACTGMANYVQTML